MSRREFLRYIPPVQYIYYARCNVFVQHNYDRLRLVHGKKRSVHSTHSHPRSLKPKIHGNYLQQALRPLCPGIDDFGSRIIKTPWISVRKFAQMDPRGPDPRDS